MKEIERLADLLSEHGGIAGFRNLIDQSLDEIGRESAWLAGLFGVQWRNDGRPTFTVDHSLAALLSVTKSPLIEWSKLPFDCFVISIPREFAPIFDNPGPTHVGLCVARSESETGYLAGVFGDANTGAWRASQDCRMGHETSVQITNARDGANGEWTLDHELTLSVQHAYRIASNVIQYVIEYKESVIPSPPRKDGTTSKTYRVAAPRDVVVDREFRELARRLVSARGFDGARRALAHLVRGHWRNQPVGEGRQERRMTWVRPHKRGGEHLGRVIERVERLVARGAD